MMWELQGNAGCFGGELISGGSEQAGTSQSLSVVVITSALHAEGRQFEPGRDHSLLAKHFHVSSEACQDGRVV